MSLLEHSRPAAAGLAPDGDPADEVIRLGRGHPLPPGSLRPVHELVAEIAHAHPERPAVRSGGRTVAYGGLIAWADRIATRLAAAGVERGSRVGLLAESSDAMVAAVLAILRLGAAYVPVHREHPDRRIDEILTSARVTCVVATADEAARLTGLGLPVVRAEAEPGGERAGEHGGEHGARTVSPAVPVGGEDAAYLMYTSGSTGEPKGVLVEHAQLSASTAARRSVYPGAPVFLLVSPMAFDSSVAGLWGTLTAGGCLVVAASDEVRDPARLVELIAAHEVTGLLCVPSLYWMLLEAAERDGTERLASLDTVIVAGEALPETLVDRHFALHPGGVALVNEYGPTEATVWASYRRFETPGPVSIGGAIPGTRLYVLDEHLKPVPRGAEGELFIGGAGVARGYVDDPEATARVFLDDPFSGVEAARMYRTGDRVRWNEAGTLEFLGRLDHQVKIRGHRVELGAVETALRAVPGVRDAVTVPDPACTRLTGFVIASQEVAPEAVRDHLAERLPPVMVPARVQMVAAFPRNLNGKVDRSALRTAEDEEARAASAAGAPPGGGPTARVAAAWAQVLGRSEVPTDVNFFDMGGDSYTMFRLQDALEAHTGTRPSIVVLFRHTTVSAQAALISENGAGASGTLVGSRQEAARRALAARARRQRTNPGHTSQEAV